MAAASGELQREEKRAEDLLQVMAPELRGDAFSLAVHALTGIGPIPCLDAVPAPIVAAFANVVAPIALVDALMALSAPRLDLSPSAIQAIVAAVRVSGLPCPDHGYRTDQINTHMPLAQALAALPGWTSLDVRLSVRRRWALDLLRQVGMSVDDLKTDAESAAEEPQE